MHKRSSASGHSCDRHRATPSASHLRSTAGHSCTPGGNSASREALELSSCSLESTRYGRDDFSTSICSWQHFSKYQARTQAWPTVLPVVHTPAQSAARGQSKRDNASSAERLSSPWLRMINTLLSPIAAASASFSCTSSDTPS